MKRKAEPKIDSRAFAERWRSLEECGDALVPGILKLMDAHGLGDVLNCAENIERFLFAEESLPAKRGPKPVPGEDLWLFVELDWHFAKKRNQKLSLSAFLEAAFRRAGPNGLYGQKSWSSARRRHADVRQAVGGRCSPESSLGSAVAMDDRIQRKES